MRKTGFISRIVIMRLTAGTYYIMVAFYGGVSPYVLHVETLR